MDLTEQITLAEPSQLVKPGEVLTVVRKAEERVFNPLVVTLAAGESYTRVIDREPERWHIVGFDPEQIVNLRVSLGPGVDSAGYFPVRGHGEMVLPGRGDSISVQNMGAEAVDVLLVAARNLPLELRLSGSGSRVDEHSNLSVTLGTRLDDVNDSIRAIKRANLTDHSGAITTGGTAQTVMGANTSRSYLFIQNISDEAMWLDFDATAVQDAPSIQLAAGAIFTMENSLVSTEAVSIIAASTGKKFVAKEA